MAASIEMTGDSLVVHIEGMDKLWSLKSRLEIPLANVVSAASASAEARSWLHGIRAGGTHVPGVLTAGRFSHTTSWCSGMCTTPPGRSGSSCGTNVTPGW